MSCFMVDVETDGPIPGTEDYSMILIGAVLVREPLEAAPRFLGKLRPVSQKYIPDALKVSGYTREETLQFDDPASVMRDLDRFMLENNRGKYYHFISDNNGFDYLFTSWYFCHFLGRSLFRQTSTNLGSLYKGLIKDTFRNFSRLRQTPHTHNPVDDAMGNAEALVYMKNQMGLNILLE